MTYKSTVLADSPTNLWMLDEASGSGTAADSVGSVTLTATSVTFASTAMKTNIPLSASFNGTTSKLKGGTFGVRATPSPNYSLEAWINLSSASRANMIFHGGDTSALGVEFYVDSTHVLGVYDSGINGSTPSLGSGTVDNGAVHYVAVIWNGTTMTFYIDGVQDVVRTPTQTGAAANASGAYCIGISDLASPTEWFTGKIAAAAYYVGANQLTATKIANHYMAGIRGKMLSTIGVA